MVYKYSIILRDMVKLFPRGDLEPMTYFPETQSRENRPWAQDHQGKIVSLYPELRSCYICFIHLNSAFLYHPFRPISHLKQLLKFFELYY